MRRELFGSVTYCWPAICWPLETSQRRNFGLQPSVRPPAGAPVTMNCALIMRQASNWAPRPVAHLFDEASRIDRLQKHRTREIIGDDPGQVLLRIADEIGDRDRHRLELRTANVEIALRESWPWRPWAQRQACHQARRGTARDLNCHWLVFPGQRQCSLEMMESAVGNLCRGRLAIQSTFIPPSLPDRNARCGSSIRCK